MKKILFVLFISACSLVESKESFDFSLIDEQKLTHYLDYYTLYNNDIHEHDSLIKQMIIYVNLNSGTDNLKEQVRLKHILKFLASVVKIKKRPTNILEDLELMSLVLKNHNFTRKWKSLDDIIWWCELRSIEDKKSQIQFLNNQMSSTKKLDALKMLTELGEVKTIEKWSNKLSFENSETIFKLAIKQAKLMQASIENNKHLAKLFTQELNQSISQVIKNKRFYDTYYQQHIRWLIIQIGTHKQDKKFKNLLENLAQDNLFYNRDLIKSMAKEKKQKLAEEMETKFKISKDAKFILNPEGDN